MTEEYVRKLCREMKLYDTPYLNDILYLHYKGKEFMFIDEGLSLLMESASKLHEKLR